MGSVDLRHLGPQYHSYRLLGATNEQLPGIYPPNQACKEPILLAYIQLAIAKCRTTIATPVSFAELFCADGYHAMMARRLGATASMGIDNDREGHFGTASKVAAAVGLSDVRFLRMEVDAIDTLPPVDIVANVGGLYHVADPLAILAKSYAMARRFLIVQSVVSLATDDPRYFASPAPGWHWGSRFSRASFDRAMRETGWDIVDSHFNELEGNDRPEDRGSAYYLVRKPTAPGGPA
ncbi:MAG: hypothetical protein FJ029_12680 [Actinobacteria bacterium]|nr:hypothetical protein [Actinomycetota bacterium]